MRYTEKRESPLKQGPRTLPPGLEGRIWKGQSRAYTVERLIRTVWSETRNSEPVSGTVKRLRLWVRSSDSPVMWETRIRWGLLSFVVDPKISDLDRLYLTSILNEWDLKTESEDVTL